MKRQKITPAKPRRERSYPQVPRVFSTQAGIHPSKSGISEWVQYYHLRTLLDNYRELIKLYRNRVFLHVDLDSSHAVQPFVVFQGVENYLPGALWVPYEDYLKVFKKAVSLVNRHNNNLRNYRA